MALELLSWNAVHKTKTVALVSCIALHGPSAVDMSGIVFKSKPIRRALFSIYEVFDFGSKVFGCRPGLC